METTFTSWLTLAGLGAFHGLNPGMGWLFAVALGMQERQAQRGVAGADSAHARTRAGDCSGHRQSPWLPAPRCRPACCAGRWRSCWPASGVRQLYRHAASALGGHAGRYGRPDALVVSDGIGARRGTDGAAGVSVDDGGGRRSVLPCAGSLDAGSCRCDGDAGAWLGYLAVTALAAWIVVDRFGLGLLRKAWINLDVIWAAALILTGCLTLVT